MHDLNLDTEEAQESIRIVQALKDVLEMKDIAEILPNIKVLLENLAKSQDGLQHHRRVADALMYALKVHSVDDLIPAVERLVESANGVRSYKKL